MPHRRAEPPGRTTPASRSLDRMSDDTGTWVEFADDPKRQAFLRVMRIALPVTVLGGTATVF